MTLQEIFNTLQADKKLTLTFDSPVAAESFRIQMHHLKTRQESHMLSVGLMTDDDVKSLKFKRIGTTVQWSLSLELRVPKREYNVVLVEDEEENKVVIPAAA